VSKVLFDYVLSGSPRHEKLSI